MSHLKCCRYDAAALPFAVMPTPGHASDLPGALWRSSGRQFGERAKVGEGTNGELLGMSRRIHVDYAARYRNGGSEPCG